MDAEVAQGFFSLLRWRHDVTRDEEKNVAVLLVAPDEGVGVVRSAPLSRISSQLKEQGLLDSVLVQLERRLANEAKAGIDVLVAMHESLERSLLVTPPQPVAVSNIEQVADALYKAYIAPKAGGGGPITKGVLLDRVVGLLRRGGLDIGRGVYVGDFIFDAVVHPDHPSAVIEVLSFATSRKDWAPVVHDAGHFLYALERIAIPGTAIVQPPPTEKTEGALQSFDRVQRWLHEAHVQVLEPRDLSQTQGALIESF